MSWKKFALPAIGLILAGAGCNASTSLDVNSDAASGTQLEGSGSTEIDAEINALDQSMGTVDADGYGSAGLDDTE